MTTFHKSHVPLRHEPTGLASGTPEDRFREPPRRRSGREPKGGRHHVERPPRHGRRPFHRFQYSDATSCTVILRRRPKAGLEGWWVPSDHPAGHVGAKAQLPPSICFFRLSSPAL
ncbi:hypothetical protein EJV44_01625 [Ancylobacter aquaticus]|nr:hypothetical protein EJV44_01625 [Ancylobacter aquaticus]